MSTFEEILKKFDTPGHHVLKAVNITASQNYEWEAKKIILFYCD